MVSAMAHCQLKQADQARLAFAQGNEIADTKLPSLGGGDLGRNWRSWIYADALRKQAATLIQRLGSGERDANALSGKTGEK